MNEQKSRKLGGSLLLMLTALIWGVSFVAQSVSAELVGPFTFNAVRFLLGGLVLMPWILFLERRRRMAGAEKQKGPEKESGRPLLVGGICCGLALCAASNLQQLGIGYTTVGKAGFITAMYIVIVPFLGLLAGRRPGFAAWAGVALGVVGLYFLCMTESFTVGRGDLYVIACALVFAVHILLIDYFSPLTDGIKLSCVQFLVCGLMSGILALLREQISFAALVSAWAPILYAGVLSCGVGYTLQTVGQKWLEPTAASLLLSLESLFSALAGFALLGQQLTSRELMGCALMAAAIVLAQLPDHSRRKEKSPEF